MKIETWLFGSGTVERVTFSRAGKLVILASFPGFGRQFVTGRHLVTIDGLCSAQN